MPDHMTVLIVGAGTMAIAYAHVLRALGRSFACIGRGAASAQRFAHETGVTPSLGGLQVTPLAASHFSAAIVAVPVDELADASRRLLDAGFHRLLIEKPAGIDAAQIRSLAEECARRGVAAYVAYNRRFYASVAAARAMLAADGGATSAHIDFSELASRILTPDKTPELLRAWFLANATHVLDLAFHLAGEPIQLDCLAAGELAWHRPATFAGAGRTARGALLSWHADWSAPGRWGLDIRSRSHRIVLQPLEQLHVQRPNSFALEAVALDDDLDHRFKPGLYRQVKAFLEGGDDRGLATLDEQARRLPAYLAIRDGGALTRTGPDGRRSEHRT
jgi:predicted dehydrogenase